MNFFKKNILICATAIALAVSTPVQAKSSFLKKALIGGAILGAGVLVGKKLAESNQQETQPVQTVPQNQQLPTPPAGYGYFQVTVSKL